MHPWFKLVLYGSSFSSTNADRTVVKYKQKRTNVWRGNGDLELDDWCPDCQVLPDMHHHHWVRENLKKNAVFCALTTWQFIQRLYGFEGSLWRLFVQIRPDSDCHRASAAQPLMQTDRCRAAGCRLIAFALSLALITWFFSLLKSWQHCEFLQFQTNVHY